jgi:hypothetical protein
MVVFSWKLSVSYYTYKLLEYCEKLCLLECYAVWLL